MPFLTQVPLEIDCADGAELILNWGENDPDFVDRASTRMLGGRCSC